MKTGMLGSVDIIELAARKIDEHKLTQVVIDPVMVCKGEDEVLQPENTDAMRELLVPRAMIVTPNLFEAGQLAKTGPIKTIDEMKTAAVKIHDLGAKNVVIKGGKQLDHDKAIDLFYDGSEFTLLENEKIDTTYNHGGRLYICCSYYCRACKRKLCKRSSYLAKKFVAAAIEHGFKLNQYVGPVMHGAYTRFVANK